MKSLVAFFNDQICVYIAFEPIINHNPKIGAARVFWVALPEFDVTATQLGSVFGSASCVTSVHDRVKDVYAAFDGSH